MVRHTLAERIGIGPVAPRCCLVDDGDPRRVGAVGGGEVPPAQQGSTKDPKDGWRDGKLHEVSVRVTTGGMKTRAKKNYVAPKE